MREYRVNWKKKFSKIIVMDRQAIQSEKTLAITNCTVYVDLETKTLLKTTTKRKKKPWHELFGKYFQIENQNIFKRQNNNWRK